MCVCLGARGGALVGRHGLSLLTQVQPHAKVLSWHLGLALCGPDEPGLRAQVAQAGDGQTSSLYQQPQAPLPFPAVFAASQSCPKALSLSRTLFQQRCFPGSTAGVCARSLGSWVVISLDHRVKAGPLGQRLWVHPSEAAAAPLKPDPSLPRLHSPGAARWEPSSPGRC